MGKLDINITQTQQIVMGFISPIIDEIVDRVSERVLAASKKEPKFYTRKEAAEILHVTLPTLARITKECLLASTWVGSESQVMCVPFNTNERSCCELHSTLSLPIRIYAVRVPS